MNMYQRINYLLATYQGWPSSTQEIDDIDDSFLDVIATKNHLA